MTLSWQFASVTDEDDLVCEILEDDEFFGTVSIRGSSLVLEIYPPPTANWQIRVTELRSALEAADNRLSGPRSE
jgi:hypothetical protein